MWKFILICVEFCELFIKMEGIGIINIYAKKQLFDIWKVILICVNFLEINYFSYVNYSYICNGIFTMRTPMLRNSKDIAMV